jgi:hypothetical protein
MADITTIKWLYPPNFEGTYEAGAKGHRRHVVECTCYSDGSGEDESIKVKRTDLLTPDGEIPTKLIIEKIDYDIKGMTVTISYDNLNDDVVAVLADSSGCKDYTKTGGFAPIYETNDLYESGNIIFTTSGMSMGDSYNITLTVRPHQ